MIFVFFQRGIFKHSYKQIYRKEELTEYFNPRNFLKFFGIQLKEIFLQLLMYLSELLSFFLWET